MPVGTFHRGTPRPADSAALVTLLLEFVAVGVFTILAGASDNAATIVILMMVGFWLIYMVTNSKILAGLENALGSLSGNPTNAR